MKLGSAHRDIPATRLDKFGKTQAERRLEVMRAAKIATRRALAKLAKASTSPTK